MNRKLTALLLFVLSSSYSLQNYIRATWELNHHTHLFIIFHFLSVNRFGGQCLYPQVLTPGSATTERDTGTERQSEHHKRQTHLINSAWGLLCPSECHLLLSVGVWGAMRCREGSSVFGGNGPEMTVYMGGTCLRPSQATLWKSTSFSL